MRRPELLTLLCMAALASAGCSSKHIVLAVPPSVSSPPPAETPPPPPPAPPPPAETKTVTPPELTLPEPPPEPPKRPAPRPRPAPPAESAPAKPAPEPPQISPELSAQALAAAQSRTTVDITTAEKNVQMASGRQLNGPQKDLIEKIKGFLGQAHEAIRADDWVRAQNLAEKARILSQELANSF